MDHPYQSAMQLPAAYAVITEEEMTYLNGGSDVVLGQAFGYQLSLDTDQFLSFCTNVVVNLSSYVMSASFSYILGLLQSGRNNGLSLGGTIAHVWGKQQTTWSKISTIGTAGLAGIYVGVQAVQIYQMVKSLYDAVVNPMPDFSGAQTATQAAA